MILKHSGEKKPSFSIVAKSLYFEEMKTIQLVHFFMPTTPLMDVSSPNLLFCVIDTE